MRLEGIQTGDIVEVDHKGRRFHAIVTGPAPAAWRSSRPTGASTTTAAAAAR